MPDEERRLTDCEPAPDPSYQMIMGGVILRAVLLRYPKKVRSQIVGDITDMLEVFQNMVAVVGIRATPRERLMARECRKAIVWWRDARRMIEPS